MESAVHAAVPLRVGKKMRKRRELDALVGGGVSRGGRLLSASSDECEPWGRRTTRRRRTRPFMRLAACLALCVCVVSAATVLWLFIDVRRQIVSLRIEMDKVITSSNSVGDTLQNCHSMTRILQANASDLSIRLTKLELKHKELAEQVEKATSDLGQVTEKLSAEPLLADMPRRLSELQRTVGLIGSRVNGFDEAVKSVRTLATTAGSGVEEVKTLLHSLEARSNETIANVSASSRKEDELKEQVVALNSTLTGKVEALQTRVEELSKPASAPATTTTPARATAPATTPAHTTTLPPGPPAKPFVLQ